MKKKRRYAKRIGDKERKAYIRVEEKRRKDFEMREAHTHARLGAGIYVEGEIL